MLDVRAGLQNSSRRRSIDLSRRSSRGLAYVDGNVRDRQVSPSSLSKSNCCDGHPDEAGVERLGEHLAPCGLFGLVGRYVLAGGPVQSHGRRTHVGVPDERREVRAQRQRFQRGDVLVAVAPRLVLVDRADDVLAGNGFHAAEQVAGVGAVDVNGGQRTRPEHDRRHPVAQRLGQRRAVQHLDVVVRVDVDHPW